MGQGFPQRRGFMSISMAAHPRLCWCQQRLAEPQFLSCDLVALCVPPAPPNSPELPRGAAPGTPQAHVLLLVRDYPSRGEGTQL